MAINPIGGGFPQQIPGGGAPGGGGAPNRLQKVQQDLAGLQKEDKAKIKQQLEQDLQADGAGGAKPQAPQQNEPGKENVTKVQNEVSTLTKGEKTVIKNQLDQEDKVTQSQEAQGAGGGGGGGEEKGGGDDAGSKIGDMIGNIAQSIGGMAGGDKGGDKGGAAAPKADAAPKISAPKISTPKIGGAAKP